MTVEDKRASYDFFGTIERETAKALLVTDGKTQAWFPKRLVKTEPDEYNHGRFVITVPLTWAKMKGLVK